MKWHDKQRCAHRYVSHSWIGFSLTPSNSLNLSYTLEVIQPEVREPGFNEFFSPTVIVYQQPAHPVVPFKAFSASAGKSASVASGQFSEKESWILKTQLRHLPPLRENINRYVGSQGWAATCPINPGYLLQRLTRKSGDLDDQCSSISNFYFLTVILALTL